MSGFLSVMQGCVMSPVLLNVYMDGVVRSVNATGVFGRDLKLMVRMDGRFEINQLLFADDTALVADSEEKLCGVIS